MPSGFNAAHLTGAGTTILAAGSCLLHSVSINNAAAATLTLYDNTTASGKVLAVITTTTSTPLTTLLYDAQCLVGLCAVVTGTNDFTLSYG